MYCTQYDLLPAAPSGDQEADSGKNGTVKKSCYFYYFYKPKGPASGNARYLLFRAGIGKRAR